MNEQEFKQLVKEMRDAQKNYFKTRTNLTLTKAKQLEKQVDDELEDRLI